MSERSSIPGAIHDLQARLGSIRIAVTAVAGLELDADTRREMLDSASAETLRASAELAAIGALAACAGSGREVVDLGKALREAATLARLAGIVVDVTSDDGLVTSCEKEQLIGALAAQFRLVAGAGSSIHVTAQRVDQRSRVAIERLGDEIEPLPSVAAYLIEAIAGIAERRDTSLTFTLEAVTE